ncbi:Cytochrome protein, partial [Ophiophagus hannah]
MFSFITTSPKLKRNLRFTTLSGLPLVQPHTWFLLDSPLSWWYSPDLDQFSFLMTEALLTFSPESSLLRSFSRKAKVRFHWALQLLALICALLGLAIISYNKYLNGKEHFVTWHGQTGLLTVVYATLQCMGGLALLYPKLMKNWTLSKLKLYHATSGLIGYLLGCASLMLGMCSLWFSTTMTGISWYLIMLCPILTSLVIMNQVSNAYLY